MQATAMIENSKTTTVFNYGNKHFADKDNDNNSEKFLMFLDCFEFLFKWL